METINWEINNMKNECKEFLECDYLKQLFNHIRIVDPIKKIVVKEMGNDIRENCNCFDIWERKSVCLNCISIRAYNEKKNIMKIEYNEGKEYMIIAKPILIEGKEYVVETIRDITECEFMNVVGNKSKDNIRSKFDKLNKLIVTDELTQCYNRRYINERLPIDINIAKKDNNELTIAMIDIDYFKVINDTHGHLVGDEVIKDICNIIKSNIREDNDWIARYGGEEFLILFKNTSCDEAYNLLNFIKSIIEKRKFIYNCIEIKVTISIGIATMTNEVNTTEKLIEVADKNLYKAKELGRNLIVI